MSQVATFTAALIAGETTQAKLESAVADGKLSLTDFASIVAAVASAKASKTATRDISFKIGDKGGVCVVGINARFPVTLYADQWERLLARADDLRAFIKANSAKLSRK